MIEEMTSASVLSEKKATFSLSNHKNKFGQKFFQTISRLPSSMTIKCVKESTENITPSCHNMICWHKPERQQSQKYPTISNQIWHKQKYIFLHFLSVFKGRSLFIRSQFIRFPLKRKKASLYKLHNFVRKVFDTNLNFRYQKIRNPKK